MKTKAIKYAGLIDAVRHSYASIAPVANNKGVVLQWCEDCKEINLWTYWQGKGNLNAKILLVGQDWGCPVPDSAVMQNIRAINRGQCVAYMRGNENITDARLAELFSVLGYDINSNAPQNRDLFFTNFVLGYRSQGLSGGLKKEWIERDKRYFHDLANIISPRIIICLGKATLQGVLSALGKKTKIGNYTHFIESDQNPFSLQLEDGNAVKIYGVAHCGAMGTLNRNGKTSSNDLQKQKEDWKRILEDISWR